MVDIVPAMVKHKTEKYLFAVSDVNNGTDSEILTANKIDFTRGVMYRTVSSDLTDENIHDYDMLVFFSPQGIESLQKNFPDFQQGDMCIAAFGAITGQSVKDAGLRLDIEAPNPEAPSMPAAIDRFLAQNSK